MHDGIAEWLNQFHIQIIVSPEPLPGFVIGDVPICHGNFSTQRFDFGDDLALGDSDLVMGPLTRRVLACFSISREQNQRLTAKRKLLEINNLLVRAAKNEVACYPEDTLTVQRLIRSGRPAVRP